MTANQTEQPEFPPGHWRERVAYVGDPVLPRLYYPLAEFHRRTFEAKFTEAIQLLMNLGATSIRVTTLEGWGREFAGQLDVPMPTGDLIGGSGGKRFVSSTELLFEAKFPSRQTSPVVPPGLGWHQHESTWRTIADARIKHQASTLSLGFHYLDEFGITGDFKAKIAGLGFEIGGEFYAFRATHWQLDARF